ncbi:cAMP-dependent protein kinase catalytic subunit alpha-like isoform X2 [Bolinopsis microptera]|uniref:cAMP-dependent protein kinase catalytic subunit alpha-like isoform X2 n=1 Tax=Bolinopsis microptera TaxID=2820187 RepID=UPI003078B00E
MGNVITNPGSEDEDIKKYLHKMKEEFAGKWDLESKNAELVKYFDVTEYDLLKTVGTGSFGRVMVCNEKNAEKYLAVKCLSKDCIMEKEQLEHTYSEYKIMGTIPPMEFLVNLLSFGQDNAYLYMVFEFVPGGELFSLLRSVGRIPEITATFYGAQVLAALQYLHNMDILYRDLKPENILFTANGYLKLTDFGFAKRCLGRTFTLCGTPEYLAPEIILCQGYHKAVDWWAFGVLLFEMVCGHPPFYSENPMEIYKQALEAKVRFSCKLTKDCKELIRMLLMTDPTKRVGNLRKGVKEIVEHNFFKRLNLADIFDQKIRAPFVPELEGPGDTANFDDYDEAPLLTKEDDEFIEKFTDFPWVC